LKILFTIPAYHPATDYGGPIPVARDFARCLRDRGHDVTIWTTNLATGSSKLSGKTFEGEVDGIRVVYLNSLVRYKWVGIAPDVLSYARRELKDFDVVHLFGYREFLTLAVALWAKRSGKPYVLQALGTAGRVTRSVGKKLVYDALLGRPVLRNAAALVAKGAVESQHYLDSGVPSRKIRVIPNGMDEPEILQSLSPDVFREWYGIGLDEPLILFLGRLHQVKGVDLLLRAFARLADGRARLAVVGPDEGMRQEAERFVARKGLSGRVVFTGPLYDERKWEAYLAADLYVLPSVFENFPRAVLEAMACGTPVVLTDRCGIAPQVDGRAGLVVPYDEAALTRAMERMVGDGALRSRFSEGALRLIREEFSWDGPVTELERLYGRVVTGGRNP
jgi:glycosyltransferase involved in cell wall biosynthesis